MSSKKEIQSLLLGFKNRFSSTVLKNSLLGQPEWDELIDEITGITEVFKSLSEEEIFHTYKEENVIDKFKIGANVVKLANSNYTNEEVAEIVSLQTGFTIVTQDVESWLQNYSALSTNNKPEALSGSVFDTQSRMQDIYESLQMHLEKIARMDDDYFLKAKITKSQVETEVMKELRQLTKDAASIVNAVSTMERIKEFQQMVVETINTVSPTAAQQIMRKLKEKRVILNSLIPPS